MIGMFRAGGFSVDLTHHVMHAMGSRILGFSQELFDDSAAERRPRTPEAMLRRQMAARYPYITEMARPVAHDDASVVGQRLRRPVRVRVRAGPAPGRLRTAPAARLDVPAGLIGMRPGRPVLPEA